MVRTPLSLPFSGARLREWRERAGLSQEALASKCGLSRFQLSRWETSDTKPAPWALKTLVAGLADALDRPINGPNAFELAELLDPPPRAVKGGKTW
jgi:transcriptional regulator with XRE-family HTH domain